MGVVALNDVGGVGAFGHTVTVGKQLVVAAHNIGDDGLHSLVVLSVVLFYFVINKGFPAASNVVLPQGHFCKFAASREVLNLS